MRYTAQNRQELEIAVRGGHEMCSGGAALGYWTKWLKFNNNYEDHKEKIFHMFTGFKDILVAQPSLIDAVKHLIVLVFPKSLAMHSPRCQAQR